MIRFVCSGAFAARFRWVRGFLLVIRSPHTIMLAVAATRGQRSAASRATGPLMSEPFTAPSGVASTHALSSNWPIMPAGRWNGRRWRPTPAFTTCLRLSGVPFLTVSTMRSGMPAPQPEARRRVDIHAVRPLLVALILPDEPKVLALDDDRVLHPSRHDDAFQGLAADGQSTVERALRVRARLLRYRNVNPDVPH